MFRASRLASRRVLADCLRPLLTHRPRRRRRRGCCARRPSARRRSRSPTRTTSGSVERAGGMARRLTSFQGATTNPKFSPDGKWIAFSAEYGGNVDVYVVPAEGGEPKRLTWHPGGDIVQGWTPDGKSVMFASSRATWAPSGAPRFWTVPVEGGVETADGAAARLSGQDLRRRRAHRLPHEQVVGRRAAQLSRRAEPADLDRRSEDLRPRLAAVDRFEGHRSGLGRRHRSTSFRIATASPTSGRIETRSEAAARR